jgi:predicted Zn-dependent protease
VPWPAPATIVLLLALAASSPDPGVETGGGAPAAEAGRVLDRLVAAGAMREAAAASPDGAEGLRAARAEQEAALDELRPLARSWPDDPAVLRAQAVYYGLDGRPEEVSRLAAHAGPGASDPWLAYAALAAGLRGRPAAEAEPLLAGFVAAHPGVPPPRLSLARARLALGDRDGALQALDALLAIEPDNRAGQELKASLLAPPPVQPLAPQVPTAAPRPTAPGRLPRKPTGNEAGR